MPAIKPITACPTSAIVVPLSDVKKPEYLAVNPNGRLLSIYDPNKDLTLWESGALVECLIEIAVKQYVKEINRVTAVLEKILAEQKVATSSDGPWLVGGKYSFADIAFISYQ
ncbi:hypothetical protein TOPH_08086 [Tolypocladium ophioglossoides CBS 100239]|uniref:Glutathione S-transferase C-terminal domain-containing protein n=1 Tax=Tolypocladium ophioglossoides (strain CBS 100239) TaxID=1163406 RepID=A0A0L0MZN8_TOLOC|nr:hypothetical protein TOPH_08086 [Tolypocladium ophioglossoides CBS 100239]